MMEATTEVATAAGATEPVSNEVEPVSSEPVGCSTMIQPISTENETDSQQGKKKPLVEKSVNFFSTDEIFLSSNRQIRRKKILSKKQQLKKLNCKVKKCHLTRQSINLRLWWRRRLFQLSHLRVNILPSRYDLWLRQFHLFLPSD